MLFSFKKNILLSIYTVSSFLYSSLAVAITPNAVDLDGVYFIPTFTINETFDDNIWTASGSENDPIKKSWVTKLQPSLTLSARERLNTYKLNYQLKHSEYHASNRDNKTEHVVTSRANMKFTDRHRLDLSALHTRQQAERDSINRNPLNNELGNKYRHSNLNALYGFGSQAAIMQLDFGAKIDNFKYTNNRYSGSQTHKKDYDALSGLFRANYNYSYKTKLFLETQYQNYNYKSSNLNSDVWVYLMGADWQASSKIGVKLKLGFQDKNFIDPNISDSKNKVWEASVNWRPRTYSVFTLTTNNKIEEGSATESYINIEKYILSWQHGWSQRFTTAIKYELATSNYGTLNNNINERHDNLNKYLISARYDMRSWLGFELGYDYINSESNQILNSYDRNKIHLNINVSL